MLVFVAGMSHPLSKGRSMYSCGLSFMGFGTAGPQREWFHGWVPESILGAGRGDHFG